MKNLIYAGLIMVAFLAGCSNKKEAKKETEKVVHQVAKKQYTCPMHPQILEDHPGDCPVCGMELVEVHHQDAKVNTLKFSTAQMELANITEMTVGMGSAGQGRLINGRLAADEQQASVISTRSAGRIERLMIKQTGVRVNKGQPLYELYSEELLTLEKEYLLAVDQNQALGKTNERFASFLKAAEQKLILYGLTGSQISALRKSHQVQPKITIYAVSGGVITGIQAAEGQYVAEGAAIYALQNLNQLWVEGEVYPEEVAKVKIGQSVGVRIAGQEDQLLSATVTFINPAYEAGSQLTLIRANIQNTNSSLQPGMPVQLALPATGGSSLTVPLTGIVRDAKGSMVFVKTAKNTFVPRMVKTGAENARRIEITEGLNAGDVIAGTGAYLIYSDMILKQGGMDMGGMNMQGMKMEDMKMDDMQGDMKGMKM